MYSLSFLGCTMTVMIEPCFTSSQRWILKQLSARQKKVSERGAAVLSSSFTLPEFSLRSSAHVPSVATVTVTSFPVPTVLLATRLNLCVSFFLSFVSLSCCFFRQPLIIVWRVIHTFLCFLSFIQLLEMVVPLLLIFRHPWTASGV